MFRRSIMRLMEGERNFSMAGASPQLEATGGLPFYGNIYAGRVDTQNYMPPHQEGSGLIVPHKSLWDDPNVRAKMNRCPYFALCDQVLWHNMDPAYLDPGVLTSEEHQLLLLFSRAYYEKWKVIHERPANALPRIRIKYGASTVLDEMLNRLHISSNVSECLKKEFQLDDASLIAMVPSCWSTAYLDAANLDHFSGRVLEFAGVPDAQRERFFLLLSQMRRIVVHRRDTPSPEEFVLPFSEGVTLYDLYRRLGLQPYSGQLKVYDYVDSNRTRRVVTLQDEDTYFDYLISLFYTPDFTKATLSDVADESDNTCRFVVTVEPFTVSERRVGRWF